MARSRVDDVRVAGLASAVPETLVTAEDDAKVFGEEETRRVVKNTGVVSRRTARYLTVSDMAGDATERLLADLRWPKDSIDVVLLVTQCPDYPAPATACLMQHALGLPTRVAAFDVNLGCSGYTYGLWMLGTFLASGSMKRGLLFSGDTATRAASPYDRSVVPLFGDAGTVTALEHAPGAPPMHFVMGTDGSGGRHLHTRGGGGRHPADASSFDMRECDDGVLRHDCQTRMNGAEVLTWALKGVPPMLAELRDYSGWREEDVVAYVFHQASVFMLNNVARVSRIPRQKLVLGMERFGNTSSASIPLAMTDQLRRLSGTTERLVLGGFGIGWSWCVCTLEAGPMVMPEVLIVPDQKRTPPF